jgi:hypothetical protein
MYASPLFQAILVCVTTGILGYYFTRETYRFTSTDREPTILPLTAERISFFGGSPDPVAVGINIRDFFNFDVVRNEFIFTGIIWFEFDPSVVSLDAISKFSLMRGEILDRSEPNTRITSGGKVMAQYEVRIKLTTPLDYRYFPIDDHKIALGITNNFLQPDEIIFVATTRGFFADQIVGQAGWRPVDFFVKTGITEAMLKRDDTSKTLYHPAAMFTVHYERTGSRYALLIFLPLLLIFYLSLFSLSLDPARYTGSILSLGAGGVSAMLAYRFVIESLSPAVGYFMLSDYFYFLFLVLTMIIFFVDIFAQRMNGHQKELVVLILHAATLGVGVYLMGFWLQ